MKHHYINDGKIKSIQHSKSMQGKSIRLTPIGQAIRGTTLSSRLHKDVKYLWKTGLKERKGEEKGPEVPKHVR